MRKVIAAFIFMGLSVAAYAQAPFDLPSMMVSDIQVSSEVPALMLSRVQGDRILIEKKAHRLTVYAKGAVIRVFVADFGRGGLGKKLKEGDNLTPEGVYKLDYRNPQSQFHLSLHITYPNKDDVAAAKLAGVDPGGEIFIHGYGRCAVPLRRWDWTYGCIALLNSDIAELWDLVPNGITVEIRP